MNFIFRPGEPANGLRLGGKASALARLHGHFPIPHWFVLLPDGCELIARPAAEVEPVREQLNRAMALLCPGRNEHVAVRSSAFVEDGLDRSYAGQFESVLNVHPAEVETAIEKVWRSGSGERVSAYRRRHEQQGDGVGMAVLVQRMLQPEASGIAFSIDPVSGREDEAVVTAVRGLGDRLASGDAEGEQWNLNVTTGAIRRVDETSADGGVLTETQARSVAAMARDAARHFGCAQDIEWAIENGCLYLLQSRPVTVVPEQATCHGRRCIWDNSNIVESYGGVTLPLTFSFARRAYEHVYRQFCILLGVRRSKIVAHDETFKGMLGHMEGRVYYNLLNWYRLLALLPGFRANRQFMEQMMGVREPLPPEILEELERAEFWERLCDRLAMVRTIGGLIFNYWSLPRQIRRFENRFERAMAAPPVPFEEMSCEELAEHYRDLERQLLARWDAPLVNDFFAMIFYGVLRTLAARWCNDSNETLHNDLLCRGDGMISAEPARRIRQLAELIGRKPELAKAARDTPAEGMLQALLSDPEFAKEYSDYIARFGERCLDELKLESATLRDDPGLLVSAIVQAARVVELGGAHAERNHERRGEDAREIAERQLERALKQKPIRRLIFGWVLTQARERVRQRENLRFERTRAFGRVRRIFLELGKRFQSQGLLDDARDVFYLELDEVFGLIDGTGSNDAARSTVALRKEEFEEYRAGEGPPNRFETWDVSGVGGSPAVSLNPNLRANPNRDRDRNLNFNLNRNLNLLAGGDRKSRSKSKSKSRSGDEGDGVERRGIGCCAGVVRGRARVVTDPRRSAIEPGEILVAERTDPGWILLFGSAAGLLVERGSLLSHSAIVARELGLPTIVSLAGATNWIRDGDLLEMDGGTGCVRLIDRL